MSDVKVTNREHPKGTHHDFDASVTFSIANAGCGAVPLIWRSLI